MKTRRAKCSVTSFTSEPVLEPPSISSENAVQSINLSLRTFTGRTSQRRAKGTKAEGREEGHERLLNNFIVIWYNSKKIPTKEVPNEGGKMTAKVFGGSSSLDYGRPSRARFEALPRRRFSTHEPKYNNLD